MVYIRTDRTQNPKVARMVVEGLPQPPSAGAPIPWRSITQWSSNYELDQSGRPWLQAMMPILMRAKETGVFADPQDITALYNVEQAKKMMHDWWPWMKSVRLSARSTEPEMPTGRGVGSFFSGGVDSFFSLLSHFDEISHLILVKSGFDIFPPNKAVTDKTVTALTRAASEYGKPLVVLETDIREVSSRFVRWGPRYHGAALATVGQLLSPHLKEVIIPSTYQANDLVPWGTHPDLDHLWSSSYLGVAHDSAEFDRAEKVRAISGDPVAMAHLRVCWRNPASEYNCGRCEKCVRTMLALYAFGALSQCATFDDYIDLDLIDRMDLSGNHIFFAVANRDLLKAELGARDSVYVALNKRIEVELAGRAE